jgi:hypothetical protein
MFCYKMTYFDILPEDLKKEVSRHVHGLYFKVVMQELIDMTMPLVESLCVLEADKLARVSFFIIRVNGPEKINLTRWDCLTFAEVDGREKISNIKEWKKKSEVTWSWFGTRYSYFYL